MHRVRVAVSPRNIVLALAAVAALAGCVVALVSVAGGRGEDSIRDGTSRVPPSACGSACALIVEPDDGIAPVLAFIRGATRSLELVDYELEDPSIIAALVAARDRGVGVRVLLNHRTYNDAAYYSLAAAGVPVRWAPARFTFTHEKSMRADGTRGLIMTFNLVPHYYGTGRDFSVMDGDPADAAAMGAVFEADWRDVPLDPAPVGNDLVWSPGSRRALMDLIKSATGSLEIYNEEMAEDAVTAALESAARRGVRVDIVMTYSADWHTAFSALAAAGAHVRTFRESASGLYIHAKAIIADGARAFVGSENFSATSLDENRELGIMLRDPAAIAALRAVFARDRAAAEPFRAG